MTVFGVATGRIALVRPALRCDQCPLLRRIRDRDLRDTGVGRGRSADSSSRRKTGAMIANSTRLWPRERARRERGDGMTERMSPPTGWYESPAIVASRPCTSPCRRCLGSTTRRSPMGTGPDQWVSCPDVELHAGCVHDEANPRRSPLVLHRLVRGRAPRRLPRRQPDARPDRRRRGGSADRRRSAPDHLDRAIRQHRPQSEATPEPA